MHGPNMQYKYKSTVLFGFIQNIYDLYAFMGPFHENNLLVVEALENLV